ncbi:MAG: alkaline phosphatase family protein [Chloroflexota bacterium]|nr:MAG: hypothetical protein DLM70_13530 [Chloroflexota bacterium]
MKRGALIALVWTLPWLQLPSGNRASSRHLDRYAVVLVLDGARPDYLDLTAMPNLRWLVHNGVVYDRAFVGQEIANTPPSHATIGTGVFPRRHGIEGFWWQNPVTHAVTRPTDNQAVQNGALDAIMAEHHVPSIAAAIKSVDRSARIVAVSGHKCYAAEAMGTADADYILCALIYHGRWVAQAVRGHLPPPGAIDNPHWDHPIPNPHGSEAAAVQQWSLGQENHWTTSYALWAFRRVAFPRLLMINLPETDVMGHFSGARDQTMATLMRGFDSDLGRILAGYRKAGILRRTVFVVTADHGMSRIDTRLPFSILDRAIALAGATKVYLEADTAAAIGIREGWRAKTVALDIPRLAGQAIDGSYYRVFSMGAWRYLPAYTRSDLPAAMRSAMRSLADTDASAEGPNVLVFYAPHITTGDRVVRGYHWLAGHLGPQWDDQHIPLIVSGIGVRHGLLSHYPARLTDIAPTLERLIGVPVTPSDGVVLADSQVRPSQVEITRQRARSRSLTPEIMALMQRSGAR